MTLDDLLGGVARVVGRAALAATISLASLGYAQTPVRGPFSVDAQGAQATDVAAAPAPRPPRKHLRPVTGVTMRADYVVPLGDGMTLGVANLNPAAATVTVYAGTEAVDKTTPQSVLLNPGEFRWVTPGSGAVAYVGVTGADARLVHVLGQRLRMVNGHDLTETVPATSLDDLIPAGGWMPGPENPTYFNIGTCLAD
jgi:hypothetical protein